MKTIIPAVKAKSARSTVMALVLLLSLFLCDSAADYDYVAKFFLEIWGTATIDSIPSPLEDCQVDIPVISPLHLWEHNSYEFVWIAVMIAKIPDGYSEVQFGFWNECTTEEMRFLGFYPCPGFMQIYMPPGPPASYFLWLPSGCNQWDDYVGYFLFMATPGASCRFVITPTPHIEALKVKDCRGWYYSDAVAGCCAQYSATKTVSYGEDTGPVQCWGCDDVVDVKDTTWGRIKTLYR